MNVIVDEQLAPKPEATNEGNKPTTEEKPTEELLTIAPSNFFGAYALEEITTGNTFVSTGDPFLIPRGSYDADAQLLEFGKTELHFSDMRFRSSDPIMQISALDLSRLSAHEEQWTVSQAYWLHFFHRYDDATIHFDPLRDSDEQFLAFCAAWNPQKNICNKEWTISSDAIARDFSDNDIAIAWMKKIPRAPIPVIPPKPVEIVVENPIVIPEPIPIPPKSLFTVTPSNIPATLMLIDESGKITTATNGPIEVEKGIYHAQLKFFFSSVSVIELDGVAIDANATLMELDENILARAAASSPAANGLGAMAVRPNYAFSSGLIAFRLKQNPDIFWSCGEWNGKSAECGRAWEKIHSIPVSDAITEDASTHWFELAHGPQAIKWENLSKNLRLEKSLPSYAANDIPHIEAIVSKSDGELVDSPLEAFMTLPDGSTLPVDTARIRKKQTGKFDMPIPLPRSFRPGLYTISVRALDASIADDPMDLASAGDVSLSAIRFQSTPLPEGNVSFYWGLLAVNTHKSIYRPNETAEFEIVVLDKNSLGVEGAQIELAIQSPSGATSIISSGVASGVLETTTPGIYMAQLPVVEEGTYLVQAHALAPGIDSTIETTFEVHSNYDFDIVRWTATKIDPARQPIDVALTVSPFTSTAQTITVREFLPLDLNVNVDDPTATIIETATEKIIEWTNVQVSSAQPTTLHYQYTVPPIQPWLYLLGPIEITPTSPSNLSVFSEARSWMIAIDANPTSKLFFRQTSFTTIPEPKPNDANCGLGCGIVGYLSGNNPIFGISDINGGASDTNVTPSGTTVGIVKMVSFVSPPLVPQTITASGTWMAGIKCGRASGGTVTAYAWFNIYRWIADTDSNGQRIITSLTTTTNCTTTDTMRQATKAGQVSSVTFARGDEIVVEVDVNNTTTTSRNITFTYGNTGSGNDGNVILPSGVTLQFAGDANTQIVSPANESTKDGNIEFTIDANATCFISASTINSGFSCGDVNVSLQYCILSGGACGSFSDMNTTSTSPLYISSGSALQSDDVLAAGDVNSFRFNVKGTQTGTFTIRSKIDSNWMQDINYSNRAAGDINVTIITPSLSYQIDNPSGDNATYITGNNFSVSASVTCAYDLNCGSVDTNLQFCSGTGCTNFTNVVAGSGGLQLVSGTIPDSNADLNYNKKYDVNWTILGSTSGTYELQLSGKGSNTIVKTSDVNALTVTVSPIQCDLNNQTCYNVGWNGGVASDFAGHTSSGSGVQLVNVDNNAYANDLLITVSDADINGVFNNTDNGAVYLIKDIDAKAGQKDLISLSNFDALWNGGLSNDALGQTGTASSGVKLVDLDGNGYTNDLLIISYLTDNAQTNSGSVHVIMDIDKRSGINDLRTSSNYNKRWDGESVDDQIGNSSSINDGIKLINIDGNALSNDLLISAPVADTNGKTNSGAVYLIKDITTKTSWGTLQQATAYDARWNGGSASDQLGQGALDGMLLVNVDGNAIANDLILVASNADINSKTDAGAIYLIKDIGTKSGVFNLDLNGSPVFDVRWNGGSASDFLGLVSNGNVSPIVINTDGNSYANDLLFGASVADINGKSNAGAIYLIKDIDKLNGIYDLDNVNNFNARWSGAAASDSLGQAHGSGYIVADIDGNGYANDLITGAVVADYNSKADTGVVYLIMDINTISGVEDLVLRNNFFAAWHGASGADSLSWTGSAVHPGIQLVNVDNNVRKNDLLITSTPADVNGKADSGAVYLIKDIINKRGEKEFSSTSAYDVIWQGGIASDQLGNTSATGLLGVQLVNVDGNSYSNDLLISAYIADLAGLTNNGAVYLIKNIDSKSGSYDFNTTSNFDVAWGGGTSSDSLGGTSSSGQGVQLLFPGDDNFSNRLLLSMGLGDANGKTNVGTAYYISDINLLSGVKLLSNNSNYQQLWNGGIAADQLSNTNDSSTGAQVINGDGNAYRNDLLLTAINADVNSKTNSGGIYLSKDFFSLTSTLTVKVISPSDYNTLSGIQRIDFNLSGFELKATDINIDLNYSSSSTEGTGTIITDDGNVATTANLYCDYNNLNYSKTCHYTWNTTLVTDGNYYILLRARSATLTDFDASNNSFRTSNVSEPYGFALFLPTSGCTNGKGRISSGNGACEKIYFEPTDLFGVSDENQVNPEGQTASIPFLVYDNQSTSASDLNILLDLNQSLPSYLVFKVSKIYNGYAPGCTGNTDNNCLAPTTTATNAGKALYSTGTQDLNLFIWTDFVAANIGRDDRNLDSNSVAPT